MLGKEKLDRSRSNKITIKEEHELEQGEAFKADLLGRIDAITNFMESEIPSRPSLWNWFIMIPLLAEITCSIVVLTVGYCTIRLAYWMF